MTTTTASAEKPIPADVDAEEALLGALLIDTEAVNAVAPMLDGKDFYREKNRWVYEACLAIADRFEATDQVTVANELHRQHRLDGAGGVTYLTGLVSMTPTSVHAQFYAGLIKRAAIQRQIISAAGQIARIGYEGGEPSAMLTKAYDQLLGITDLQLSGGFRSLADIAKAERARRDLWLDNPQAASGIRTKLTDLDRLIGGLKPGTFYVVGARPSIGKSQLVLTIGKNVASQGHAVGEFSLEMPGHATLHRLVLAEAGLDELAIRSGQAPSNWRQLYRQAEATIAQLGFFMDDTSDITTGAMRARAAQLKARHPNLGLLIVDYGQKVADARDQNETVRISDVTDRLFDLAHHLDVPLLAVYQLGRSVEDRPGKVPQMSDLYFSSRIEANADVVMLLYRKAYYHEHEPDNPLYNLQPGEEYRMDVLVEKQRNGPTGKVALWYNPAIGKIGGWGEGGRYVE